MKRSVSSDAFRSEPKKDRMQATLHRYFDVPSGQASTSRHQDFLQPEKRSAAEMIGIRVYSKEEIERSEGMTKDFYRFWNLKAEEICSDEETLKKLGRSVTGIQGAIHTSWVLRKSELLELEGSKIKELAKEAYPDLVTRGKKLKSLETGLMRMGVAMTAVTSAYEQIAADTGPASLTSKQQLHDRMSELKQAQESLRKALQRKRTEIGEMKLEALSSSEVILAKPAELTSSEVESLAVDVLEQAPDDQ